MQSFTSSWQMLDLLFMSLAPASGLIITIQLFEEGNNYLCWHIQQISICAHSLYIFLPVRRVLSSHSIPSSHPSVVQEANIGQPRGGKCRLMSPNFFSNILLLVFFELLVDLPISFSPSSSSFSRALPRFGTGRHQLTVFTLSFWKCSKVLIFRWKCWFIMFGKDRPHGAAS